MAIDNARLSRQARKHILHFTYKEAKKLTTVRFSSVVKIQHDMSLSMSPKFIGNIPLGIKETLSKLLLTYNGDLYGVPLAFNNIKIGDSQIVDDLNLFQLDIKVSFVVFKPEPGELLNAVVNKITDHHFGCVIHNCINGSVRQPKMDALTAEQQEITKNIEVGDVIIFKVWRLDIHHGILFVLGDIIGPCYYRTRQNKQRYSSSHTTVGSSKENAEGRNPEEFSVSEQTLIKEEPNADMIQNIGGISPKKKNVTEESVYEQTLNDNDNDHEQSPNKKKKRKKINNSSSDGSVKIKEEPLLHEDIPEEEKTLQKNKKKEIHRTNSNENTIHKLPLAPGLIKREEESPNKTDIQQNESVEITPKKKKTKKSEKSNNDQEFPIDPSPIKTESSPCYKNSALEMSPKKKKRKKEALCVSQDSVTESSQFRKTEIFKENYFSSPANNQENSELILTKKIYTSDKDIMKDLVSEESQNRKKMKKQSLFDSEEFLHDSRVEISPEKNGKSKRDLQIKQEPLSHNNNLIVNLEENVLNMEDKNGPNISISLLSSASPIKKKRKKKIKEEAVSDTDLFASDKETLVKKKKIKETY